MAGKEGILVAVLGENDPAEFHGLWGSDLPSRQKTIERIAVGWCSSRDECDQCCDGGKGSEQCLKWLKAAGRFKQAEGALNELLEGE